MASIKDKNNDFLNAFWDLASDDRDKRIASTNFIISHVQECEKKGNSVDTDYALKRLVRGLGSSRDSARQGFAACLADLLKVGTQISVDTTLALIDENTKISGSLKGSEERDFLFGKLFGYLAILRSGKIDKGGENAANIVDRLLELHGKKGWIKEVVSEAILSVLATVPASSLETILPKVTGLLGDAPLEDYSAWQISLAVGLQNFANASSSAIVKDLIIAALPEPDIICPETIELITPTLIVATHGFPKLHRVWDYVMSSIFSMDVNDRVLPQKRVASLTSKQVEMLKSFSAFIDKHLLPSSQEKRSVALRLSVELVRRTPADFMSVALSRAAVKCIYACRVNRKHTLNQLAGGVLRDIVTAVGADATGRLALASSFVQFGGRVNFDANTGTKTVATLLEGLGEEAVAAHVKFLCGVVGGAANTTASAAVVTKAKPVVADKKTTKKDIKNDKKKKAAAQDSTDSEEEDGENGSEGENEEDVEEEEESASSSAKGAIEALYSMAKNSKIANRAFVASACVSVFVRLSCFGAGVTKPSSSAIVPGSSKKSKKSKGGDATDPSSSAAASASLLLSSARDVLPQNIVELIRLAEGTDNDNDDDDDLAELATSKLLALLADIGHLSLSQLAVVPTGDDGKKGQPQQHPHGGVTVLDVAVVALRYLSESGVALRRSSGDDDKDDEEDEEGAGDSVKALVQSVLKTLTDIAPPPTATATATTTVSVSVSSISKNTVATPGKKNKDKKNIEPEPEPQPHNHAELHTAATIAKLREALYGLLGHALFQCLTSEDVELQAVEDIASAAPALVAEAQNKAAKTKTTADVEDEEEDEDEDRPQATLLDACMELLSVSGDHAVKGVRDSVKRAWNAICQICDIEEEVLDSVLATVVGEDGDEAEEEDGSKGKNKKRKHEEEDEEEDEESEEEDGSEGEDEEDEDGSEGDDEEVKLGEDEALDFLAQDLDEEDDEAVARLVGKNVSVLEHTEEADSALAQMLLLRKQNRKKGLLEAKRNQLVIRSRAADIMEVIINRCEAPEILLPLVLPLLRCLKKVQAPSIQSLQEGRAFEQRLRAILEQKLFKKKLHLPTAHSAEDSQSIREEFLSICDEIFKGLRSPVAFLRPVALAALLCVSRGITHSSDTALHSALAAGLQAAFVEFSGKKNTHLVPKTFDEMIQRYPDFSIKAFLSELVHGCCEGKSTYLRAESCRLLGELLKRHKSLHQDSVDHIAAELPHIVKSLSLAMTTPATPSSSGSSGAQAPGDATTAADAVQAKNKSKKQKVDGDGKTAALAVAVATTAAAAAPKEIAEVRAKRLKPILNCAKELAGFFRFRAQTAAAASSSTVTSSAAAAVSAATVAAAATTPGKKGKKEKGGAAVAVAVAVDTSKKVHAEAEAQALRDFSVAVRAGHVHSSSPVVERLVVQIVQLLDNVDGSDKSSSSSSEGQAGSQHTKPAKKGELSSASSYGVVVAAAAVVGSSNEAAADDGHSKDGDIGGKNNTKKNKKNKKQEKSVLDEAEERILSSQNRDAAEKDAPEEEPVKKRKWHEQQDYSQPESVANKKDNNKKENKKEGNGKGNGK